MRQSDPLHSHGRLQQDHESFPVHLIGLTQPQGVLMVLAEPRFTITQVSANTHAHLSISPDDILGQSFLELLASTATDEQRHLTTCTETPSHISLSMITPDGPKPFDAWVHRIEEAVIVELEPSAPHVPPLASLQNVQQAIGRLRKIEESRDFLQGAVQEIQTITGYERVMIYRFDEHQAGSVVAEVKPAASVAYLGLHYPATDIPTQVRQLYQQGIMRYIPDLTAAPVELVTAAVDADAAEPLDLSNAILRGVDPCCIEYHQNMDVAALLVIALIKDDKLWGLIACHHSSPKALPHTVRSACIVLGQLIASELASKTDRQELNYLNTLQAIQSDFVDSIAKANNFKQALIHPAPRLLDVVSAQGAAICLDQDVTLVGTTPALNDVETLINWVMTTQTQDLFHTDCLSQKYPEAATYRHLASGLIVLKISQLRRYLILWFRPEVLQTVNWAGNPTEGIQETDDGRLLLCPRSSFQQWQETVSATALPWKSVEIANALALKNAIVGIVLNKADELEQINLELERSNRELESFAYAASHDLKEPLRGITNFSNIILRRYSQNLDESAIKRLRTLIKLAERMDRLIDALLRFSRLGQADLQYQPTDLNNVLTTIIDGLTAGRDENKPPLQISIPRPLPTVPADPALITEVLSNLLSNALKYTHKEQPCIEVGYLTADDLPHSERAIPADAYILYVKDDGIGIRPHHFQNIFRLFKRLHERDSYGGGTGVGLTIAKKIIERHGGEIWVESEDGEGTTFYFVLNCKEK